MRTAASLLVFCASLLAFDDSDDRKARIRGIRDYAKQGSGAISKIQPYLEDRDEEVRWEAVSAIVEIGTQHSLDPLIAATRDNNAEIQIHAADGLVNFYLPGHVRTGWTASLRRAASAFRGRFTDTNTDVIDPFINVRPEVIEALGALTRRGATMESRANAARALGILRGRAALEDLYQALRSKNTLIMYESLIAIQKMRDGESGPRIQFLLRDLDDRVQIAAIETTGILLNRAATPDLRDAYERARTIKIKRAALTAIAMLADQASRELFVPALTDRDDGLRAAAAEGYARLKDPADLPVLEKAFGEERKMQPRLSTAFALVMLGRHELSELSPLRYLINTLNSRFYKDYAQPLLVELTRDAAVRKAVYPSFPGANNEEKVHLCRILARTGDAETLSVLEPLQNDSNSEVALEAAKAIRNLKARLSM
jgi:HEAT repeat protein